MYIKKGIIIEEKEQLYYENYATNLVYSSLKTAENAIEKTIERIKNNRKLNNASQIVIGENEDFPMHEEIRGCKKDILKQLEKNLLQIKEEKNRYAMISAVIWYNIEPTVHNGLEMSERVNRLSLDDYPQYMKLVEEIGIIDFHIDNRKTLNPDMKTDTFCQFQNADGETIVLETNLTMGEQIKQLEEYKKQAKLKINNLINT